MTRPRISNQDRYFLPANDGVLDASMAGALVCWELPSERADAEALGDAVKSVGLRYLPSPPTPASALQAMLTKLHQNRNTLVKAVENNPDGSKRAAYSVYPRQEVRGRDGFVADWTVGHTVVDIGGVLDNQLSFSDNVAPEVIEDLTVQFPYYLTTLGSSDISGYLVELVKGAFRGVPPMGGAGSYFIGPEEVPVWKSLRDVLRPFGVSLHHLPAMRGSDALQFVAASVERYIRESQEALEEDLEKYRMSREKNAKEGGKKVPIQPRVLQDRSEKIQRQLQIVEHYERILGTSLESLREGLQGLQAGFGAVAVAEASEAMGSLG